MNENNPNRLLRDSQLPINQINLVYMFVYRGSGARLKTQLYTTYTRLTKTKKTNRQHRQMNRQSDLFTPYRKHGSTPYVRRRISPSVAFKENTYRGEVRRRREEDTTKKKRLKSYVRRLRRKKKMPHAIL